MLRQYVDSGALGSIYHAKSSWLRRSGIPGLGSWFTSTSMAGGGPLIDLGVHALDMALFLMDEPRVVSVTAATYSELGRRGLGGAGGHRRFGSDATGYEVEDLATAFLRFDTGATLRLEASWAAYGKAEEDIELELLGTDGGAHILVSHYADSDTLRLFTDVAGRPAVVAPVTPPSWGHTAVVADFVDVVRAGSWSAHSGMDGLRRTRIIDACYRSAREGREVLLPQS